MVQGSSPTVADAADPRAPSQTSWEKMSADERARAVLALPAVVPAELHEPEGDARRRAKTGALQALDAFLRRIARKAYVSSDLAIFYPDEARIVPDLFVVIGAPPGERTKWVVSAEGKGPDFVVEVSVTPERTKELEQRIERYAALGIAELFLLDRARRRLRGYHLPSPDARAYEVIQPEEGRLRSRVLGLDLAVEGSRIRFSYGTALLPEPDEIITRLGVMLNEATLLREEAERGSEDGARRAEAARQVAEEAMRLVEEARQRSDTEARRADELALRAERAERRLAEALSELHKLKGWE